METLLALISLCLPSLDLNLGMLQLGRLDKEVNFGQFKQLCLSLFGQKILSMSEMQISTELRLSLRILIIREFTLSPTEKKYTRVTRLKSITELI